MWSLYILDYLLDDCLVILSDSNLRWGRVRPKSWIKYSQLGTVFTSHNKGRLPPSLQILGAMLSHDDKPDMFGVRPYVRLGRRVDFSVLRFFGIWWLVMDHSSMPSRSWSVLIHQSFLKKKESCPERGFGRWATKKRLKQLCDENPCDIWVAENAESFKNYFQQFKMIQLSDGEFKHWFHVWSCHLRRVPSWSLLYFIARSYYGTFHEMVDIWMSLIRFKVLKWRVFRGLYT